ncbi:Lipid A biosynthesis lauroyl acyltransferase, partial [Haemophilus influenzae]
MKNEKLPQFQPH